MRMRRSVLALLLLSAALLSAPGAHASPTVSLVWRSSDGAGVPGGDDITAAAGDTLELDVIVNIDSSGLAAASVSLAFDPAALSVVGAPIECPAPPNLIDGVCLSTSILFYTPIAPGVTVGSGTLSEFDVAKSPPYEFASTLTIGRVSFQATGQPTAVEVFYRSGIDGIVDGNQLLTLPMAVATVNGGGTGGDVEVSASKTDELVDDVDGDGNAGPGDTVRYTVVLTNTGSQDASNVVFDDTPDSNTALVVGSVTASTGTVTTGNASGDTQVGVDVGTLAIGASATIAFDVVVDSGIDPALGMVSNQGTVTGTDLSVQTDDPDLPGAADPTVTPIVVSMCAQDLATCQADLGTCQGDLQLCLTSPPFLDSDGDGEHDLTDACPGTPAGTAVDQAGCSLAQFCGGYVVAGSSRNSPCNQADWRNDEPLGAEDCKARGDVCEPR